MKLLKEVGFNEEDGKKSYRVICTMVSWYMTPCALYLNMEWKKDLMN